MSDAEDWDEHRREENQCTVHTSLWAVGNAYAVIEAYDSGRIIANLYESLPNTSGRKMINWTLVYDVDAGKRWCITKLTAMRLLQ